MHIKFSSRSIAHVATIAWMISGCTGTSRSEAPPAPSNLTATGISDHAIQLAWSDSSSEETAFDVERATAQSGPFAPVASVQTNGAMYVDDGLTASTTYYYRMRAIGEHGDSDYTPVASATTAPMKTCVPAQTRCIQGDIGHVQTCNSSGTAWTTSTCARLSVCSNQQCRPVCDMTSTPVNSTLCIFPNQDGVNDGEWLYWTDQLLSGPDKVTGGSATSAGARAPIFSTDQNWQYAWSLTSHDIAYAQFKLNQFTAPRAQRLTFRAQRAGTVNSGMNRFSVGTFNGNRLLVASCLGGPVPFGWTTSSCFNNDSLGNLLSYDGKLNTMSLTITDDGTGNPIDLLDVNWIKLSIEP